MAETYVLIARIPPEGVDVFRSYEDAVLPYLADHGGRLERRLASGDGCTEIHVVSFPTAASLAAYRGDPRRLRHRALLERSGARLELTRVSDVP